MKFEQFQSLKKTKQNLVNIVVLNFGYLSITTTTKIMERNKQFNMLALTKKLCQSEYTKSVGFQACKCLPHLKEKERKVR